MIKQFLQIALLCLGASAAFSQPNLVDIKSLFKSEAAYQQFIGITDSLTKADSTVLAKTNIEKKAVDTAALKPVAPEKDKNASSIETITDVTIFTFKNILLAIIVLLLNWGLVKLIQRILEKFAERSTKHRVTIKGFIPIIAILLWVFASYLVVVDVFSPPKETLIAGLASAGIAVGLASQDIIKNVFSGLVIIFDSPFRVGDKIEVGSHYGEVKQIGLRSTKITTADDSMITLPNSEVMTTSVSNSNTGEANCQVVAEIYLPPNIDTVKVRKLAIEAAQVSKYIYLNKPIVALFFNAVEDGVPFMKMRLKAYVSDIRMEFAFKSDMTELVMKQLFEEEILDKSYYLNHG
mgnify:CR=1 FL=1